MDRSSRRTFDNRQVSNRLIRRMPTEWRRTRKSGLQRPRRNTSALAYSRCPTFSGRVEPGTYPHLAMAAILSAFAPPSCLWRDDLIQRQSVIQMERKVWDGSPTPIFAHASRIVGMATSHVAASGRPATATSTGEIPGAPPTRRPEVAPQPRAASSLTTGPAGRARTQTARPDSPWRWP